MAEEHLTIYLCSKPDWLIVAAVLGHDPEGRISEFYGLRARLIPSTPHPSVQTCNGQYLSAGDYPTPQARLFPSKCYNSPNSTVRVPMYLIGGCDLGHFTQRKLSASRQRPPPLNPVLATVRPPNNHSPGHGFGALVPGAAHGYVAVDTLQTC